MAVILLGVFTYLDSVLKDYVYEKIKNAITKEVLLAKLFLEEDFPGYPRFKEISELSIGVGEVIGARVTMIALDGTVLGDSDMGAEAVRDMENHLVRPEIQGALSTGIGESRRYSTTINKDMLYIAVTLGSKKPVGFVRAAVPLTDIETVSARLKKILLLALLAAFLVSGMLSFGAAFFITRPIKKISSAAIEISGGNFDRKIYSGPKDEIGDLVEAFNNMTLEVKSRIKEITAQRSRLEAVLLSMSDGVMVVDIKNRIILINKALGGIFGVIGSARGKKPLEVIRNSEIQEIADGLLEGRMVSVKKEILLSAQDKVVVVNGTPIVRDTMTKGAVMVFHDITEMRKLERMRRDFVANVSHELRTPASNIKGFAETLSSGALDDREHAAEFVKIIEENSERLVRLIEDLLELSSIESGKVPLELNKCSALEIADKVCSEIKKQAQLKNITIENVVDESELFILADKGMVFRALLNLADNAVKYTPENGKVAIFAREAEGFVEIEVKDNGPGIPDEHLERIFERFYRVDKSRSRETGSTGLGLSIVKHIAEEHGGSVRVESIFGKGSSFFLSIPSAG
jgi:two-component system, OmpR family, phosphate regulon sensor histidine kinase PhoR